ncbi:MAG: prephenate dehydrogenase [Oscillospiraceae bacterium]
MIIAIVGLGLIGGSFAKAIKKYTNHMVWGIDNNQKTIEQALKTNSIDNEISVNQLNQVDMTIIGLYPQLTIDFINENAKHFKKNSIVIDVSGIKEIIVSKATNVLTEYNVNFVGTHPMAGREYSGFEYSKFDLFNNASMIITPISNTSRTAVDCVANLAKEINFKQIVEVTPFEHDKVIAFTSQLAHIVSSAYIKSPTAEKEYGFSAGSFQDLTRVAKLNSSMWTSLFLNNKKALLYEINSIIDNLLLYKNAISNEDEVELRQLLQDGSEKKEKSIKMHENRQ